jgi:5-methylcytosine-specific restriction endonuclease McrA
MKVLTLSSAYEPLGVVDWEKAVTLLFAGKAKALSEYDHEIHSPSVSLKIPSVIVFNHNRHKRINSVRFSRKNVWIRDEGRCQYCRKSVSTKDFTLDHIVPRTIGGTTTWTNVVTCCSTCNQKKGDKPLNKSGLSLVKNPTKPSSLPYVQDVEYFYNFQAALPESWKFWLGEEYK